MHILVEAALAADLITASNLGAVPAADFFRNFDSAVNLHHRCGYSDAPFARVDSYTAWSEKELEGQNQTLYDQHEQFVDVNLKMTS